MSVRLLVHQHDRIEPRLAGKRGDGGIDVLVKVPGTNFHDVYQIKYFTKFDRGEERQARESLQRVLQSSGLSIRTWYLTMPVGVTLPRREWLDKLRNELDVPFACEWLGLDNLNQLALEFPEVKDHYVEGGHARTNEKMHALAALITATGQDLTPSGVATKLHSVIAELNGSHPHVTYTFFADDPCDDQETQTSRLRASCRTPWWPAACGA